MIELDFKRMKSILGLGDFRRGGRTVAVPGCMGTLVALLLDACSTVSSIFPPGANELALATQSLA